MRVKKIVNYFLIDIIVYGLVLVLVIFTLILDYANKWVPLIALAVTVIPRIISRWEKFEAKEGEEIDIGQYSPIIVPNEGLRGEYFYTGITYKSPHIRVKIKLRDKYTIIPKTMELFNENEHDFISSLDPIKDKPSGIPDNTDKFFNNSVRGGSFTLNLGNFEPAGRPDNIGKYKIKFIYEIEKSEKTKFYPIVLLFNG